MLKRLISVFSLGVVLGCVGAVATGGPSTAGPQESAPPPGLTAGEAVESRGGAGEWTLAEKQFWVKLQEELDEFAKRTNDHCHSQISASYVKETFRGKLTAGGNYGMIEHARSVSTSALKAILDVCNEGDMHKKSVAAKIKRVEISYGKTSYALKGGVFHATINTDDEQVSNYQRAMVAYLKKSL